MSIIDLLKKLFPFLVKAAEKAFNNLEEAAKTAGINGSLFAQIIKENVDAAESDVEALLKSKLGLTDTQYTLLVEAIAAKYSVKKENLILYLQTEFKTRTDDVLHSSLANEVFAAVAIVLSKGKLSWLTLAMGVGEFIYRKFVKGQAVKLSVATEGCNGAPMPTTSPTPYGNWVCRNKAWVWIEDAG